VLFIFWDRFFSLCVENNTKPNPVCKELGLSTATPTHWKNGSVPNADVLIKVATYFDVSVDYLLGKTEKKQAVPNEQPISPKQKLLLDISADMSDEDMKKLIEYADLLNLRHNQ
jgi:transcriptional regulator with XRE-family HTH domain